MICCNEKNEDAFSNVGEFLSNMKILSKAISGAKGVLTLMSFIAAISSGGWIAFAGILLSFLLEVSQFYSVFT
jgi:hypothetical protein